MVREHGWQLPAHSFQIVAITVFCLLAVAFYAFFVPFLGGRIWMFVLIGSYSPVALLVFILYVRCTAINPADPGIMMKFDHGGSKQVNTNEELSKEKRKRLHEYAVEHSSISSGSRSSIASVDSSRKNPNGDLGGANIPHEFLTKKRYNLRGIFCAIFVLGDCRRLEDTHDNEESNGQALYCTLCNAEVHHLSKHCRSCDKCVHGFDHHCRWLNNCVGIKNYASFIALMATSLVWVCIRAFFSCQIKYFLLLMFYFLVDARMPQLVLEAGVGIAVFVRCFVDKKSIENEITEHLGNGFRRAPFAAVVAVCSCVSIWASIHLGELLFFHMILIKKGMTTYDYVMMMRAMSMDQAGDNVEEGFHNSRSSPSGSATTGLSGGSFLGLDNTGAWCTPPRVFVDHQDEVIPHLEPGMVPSTVDPDAAGIADRGAKVPRPVHLSAWRLAKLDSKEAMRAAARARASSSVLRPVHGQQLADSEFSSSGNASVRSSVSADVRPNKENKNDPRMSPSRHSFAKSLGSRDGYESGTHSVSSFGSPSHVNETVMLSPLPQGQGLGRFSAAISVPSVLPDRPLGVEEKIMQNGSKPLFRDIKRTSVVWDQEAGRYISVPISASETRHNRPSFQTSLPDPATTSKNAKKTDIPAQSSSSVEKSPLEQSEKLMYSGQSIFFGGPLLNPPMRQSLRNDAGLSSREKQDRLVVNFLRDPKLKRDSASKQIPVFVPSGHNPNSFSGSGSK